MRASASAAILILGVLAVAPVSSACPNCKNALPTVQKMLESDSSAEPAAPAAPRQRGDMARAYAVSIMALFFILGGVAFGVIRLIVKVGGEATRDVVAPGAMPTES